MRKHDAHVADTATLLGRNLEPWRAVLAVAEWLTSCGVDGLFGRMEALSLADQKERPDLEGSDLMALTINALSHYSIKAIRAINKEGVADDEGINVITADLAQIARDIAKDQDNGPEVDPISTRRVGRVLGKMRLTEKPRPGGKGPQQWLLTKSELRGLLVSYGMTVPDGLSDTFSDTLPLLPNGTNGIDGTNGTEDEGEDVHTGEYDEGAV